MIPAVSNIAWDVADDAAACVMLRDLGIAHLEIAPTRFWRDLTAVTEIEARAVAADFVARGIEICAFQALLFGRPDLQVFGENGGRACLDYLKIVCRLAAWMGARALVFGSPKNRLRGDLPVVAAIAKAREFFREAGDHAAALNVVVCIEPNPPGYGADFLTSAAEAADFVRAVGSPGIALNFDMGEVIMNDGHTGQLVSELLPITGHFHVSEPNLAPFDADRPAHHQAAAVLHAANYAGVASVEMKAPAGGLAAVRTAVEAVKRVYGT